MKRRAGAAFVLVVASPSRRQSALAELFRFERSVLSQLGRLMTAAYQPSSTILPRDLPDSSSACARFRLAALI